MIRLNIDENTKDEIIKELTAFLAGLPVFDDIKEHTDYLTAALEACIPLEFEPGEAIVRQDDFSNSFFIIWTGSVRIEVQRANNGLVQIANAGKEFVLKLGPGEMFGELSLLAGEKRDSTVVAAEATRVVEIYRNGFEKLVRYSSKFKQRMDELYQERGKLIHLKRVPIFSHLDDESFNLLLAKTNLRILNKGERLFEQNKKIDALYVIKDGYVRLSQKVDREELIQSYVSEGHCFGQEGMLLDGTWDQTGVASTWVEAIRITRADFKEMVNKRADMFQRVLAGMPRASVMEGLGGTGVGKTSLVAMRPVVEQNYVQAESMLVMDMELCVRCGNCVRACEATHDGITRLVRRGITVARRKEQHKEGSRQFLQIPTSCLHCKDPECMIGCPTGAITRDSQREVFIQDNLCIGCGNCAVRCPWGNIAMFPLAQKEEKEVGGVTKIVELLAVKCDLCRNRDSSACVYNCPTGACIRIKPSEYFEELKLMGIVPIKQG